MLSHRPTVVSLIICGLQITHPSVSLTEIIDSQDEAYRRMRLGFVLLLVLAMGLVAGGFTGKAIAENTSNSSNGTSDSNDALLAGDIAIVSGAPSQEPPISTTSPAPAQQGIPLLLQGPTSSEAPASSKAPTGISEQGPGYSPSSDPVSALQINPSQLYQVSRQVGASLTVEEDIIGDVNEDGFVNEVDLVQVAGSLDTLAGEPSLLDVNGDGRIDIFDLATVAALQ